MNTSVEIRSGRFTVIDDPEDSGQSSPLPSPENGDVSNHPNHPNHPNLNLNLTKQQPLLDTASSATSSLSSPSTFSQSDVSSPSGAYDVVTPHHHHSYATLSSAAADTAASSQQQQQQQQQHSIGPYSAHVNNEVYTLKDVTPPPSLYRTASHSGAGGGDGGGRQTLSTSPSNGSESSESSQSTGYGSSPSEAGDGENDGSPLSGAAMRRSGRFTVIDDEDSGMNGSSERAEDDSHNQSLADRSLQYDRVQSIPEEHHSGGSGDVEGRYMAHEQQQQTESYADLLRRQQMHSDDPELAGGQQQQEHVRRMGNADVEQVYDTHHQHAHQHDHMQQTQQTQLSPVYEQTSQHNDQYESQPSPYDQQQYHQQQQQQQFEQSQYDQSQYDQQQQQQSYDQQQYDQQQFDQQQQQQQQQYDQQQYDSQQQQQQHYNPSNSSPQQQQHYDPSPTQHVTYADDQPTHYTTDDQQQQQQQLHYANTSSSYDEQTGSPSPQQQGDQYGDGSVGLDLDTLAAECGPINLFNMLYSQIAKVMEENEWLKQDNAQLREENYELQSRLGYALSHHPQHSLSVDTPSVLSSSASPDYQSPHHSPSRLTRSVTTEPHAQNTLAAQYGDEVLTKTAPIRAVTEQPLKRPSPVIIPQPAPSPSPNVERVEKEYKSSNGQSSEHRGGVLADGGEVEQSPAGNGNQSFYYPSSGSSSSSRPTSATRRMSPSHNGATTRTSSANSVVSQLSPSPVASAASTTSSIPSPLSVASKQVKRKPTVSIKAGELSPNKPCSGTLLSSTQPSISTTPTASNALSASSASASLHSAVRKSSVSANKSASPANAAAGIAVSGKKAGAVTPRKKSTTGGAAAGKADKSNFFAAVVGGSDPLDQFLSQAVSGLSGLCSLNGKSTPSTTTTSTDSSKPPTAATSTTTTSIDTSKKDRNTSTTSTASTSTAAQRDAIKALAESLHLPDRSSKSKAGDGQQQPAEARSPLMSSGGFSPLPPPSFGVGSKAKPDTDNLFL